jgi:hypothetical protein
MIVKKYLVLVLAIGLLAGNAYANSIDLTGEWAVTANLSWDGGTATADRIWTIDDDLIANTFVLEYAGADWASMIVNGVIFADGNHKVLPDEFAYYRPSLDQLYIFSDFHFWWDDVANLLRGEADIENFPKIGGVFDVTNGIMMYCEYTGRPIPEPATMLLLGSGLVGLAGFGRKRFKK